MSWLTSLDNFRKWLIRSAAWDATSLASILDGTGPSVPACCAIREFQSSFTTRRGPFGETRARELKVVLRESVKTGVSVFVLILLGVVTTGVAHAQSRRDCSAAGPTGIGFSMGRSLTPLFELSRGTFEAIEGGSIHPRGGLHLGGRVDLPIAGSWRGRVEVSGSNWPVEHQTYDANFHPVERSTLGHVESRQILAFIGRQGGRGSACGYVLAGGGLFSLRVEEARVRRSGAALAAGVEVPVTGRGALQLEAQVHMIRTGARPPMTTGALAANLSVGWLYRF